jgi:hypothetical protein
MSFIRLFVTYFSVVIALSELTIGTQLHWYPNINNTVELRFAAGETRLFCTTTHAALRIIEFSWPTFGNNNCFLTVLVNIIFLWHAEVKLTFKYIQARKL